MPTIPDQYNARERIRFVREAAKRYGIDPDAPLDAVVSPVLIKARGSEPALAKSFNAEVKAADDDAPVLTYAITTDAIDRDNDIVDPAGIDIRNYSRNSPILWSHNHDIPNIGKGEGARLTKKTATGHRGILMDVRFHLETAMSQELYKMASKGYLNAGSIGFLPLAWTEEDAEDYEGAYPYIDTVRTYSKWELLEFSLCNVPMNPTATLQTDKATEQGIRRAIEEGIIPADAEVVNLMGGGRINAGSKTNTTDNTTPSPMNDKVKGSLDERLADREKREELWDTFWILSDLVCEAIEAAEDGDTSKADGLADDFTRAGELITGHIQTIAGEGSTDDAEDVEEPDAEEMTSDAAKMIARVRTITRLFRGKALADDILGGEAGEAISGEHEGIMAAIIEAITLYEENEDPAGIEDLPASYGTAGENVRAILAAQLGIGADEGDEDEAEGEAEEETQEEAVERALSTVSRSLSALKEKKGAVLSKRNLDALTDAVKLLEGVIAQAEPEEDEKARKSVITADGMDLVKEIESLKATLAKLAVEEITDEDDAPDPVVSLFG